MKTAMHSMIVKMRHQVMNFVGSDYEQIVNKKAEFYNYIRELMLELVHH